MLACSHFCLNLSQEINNDLIYSKIVIFIKNNMAQHITKEYKIYISQILGICSNQ